ncbi:hypothetical protein ACQUQU_16355 [Thalassolituus sp. LLYu03]|uniref:hypothetical protein n=1 Tax=Thalassolituus sp. LLYu03 TaxID=3421656 RepID=UPI003D2CC5F4
MKMIKVALAAAALSSLAGCATMLSDDVATVNVATSTGKKVDITVDGQQYTVPGIVKLAKDGEDKVIEAKDPACASSTAMTTQIEPTFWVNILSLGVFGSTTDSATSKMWTYDKNVVISCQ